MHAETLACARALHVISINLIFYEGLYCLFLRTASSLDAFSSYRLARSCTACPIRTTVKPVAPNAGSSRTTAFFHSGNIAILADIKQTVSRRSQPS